MKNLLVYSALIAFCGVAVTLSSCDDGDPSTLAGPTVLVTPSTANGERGGIVTFAIAITADAGIASVKVDGTEIKSYSATTKSDAISYDYEIATTSPAGTTTLTVEVTDKQSPAKTTSQDVTITVSGKPIIEVTGAITANATWSKDNYYLLKGNVYVQAPAELTIPAGTVIFGDKVTKGALVINRGAKIHAVGTSNEPIIFTSTAPKNFRNYGDWGGVVILGKAVNNQSANQKIEGVSAPTGDDGLYGGTSDADDSGELKYVRIEFAGIALSTDNELNGLTLGSVGSGTELDHIQVSYSGDDSFEWFGGTVNAQYLIAYRGWDDDFDTDFGFSGNVQYAVSHRDPNIADKSGSNAFESDNDGAGSTKTPLTAAKFSNVSWYGPGVYAKLNGTALNKGNYNANFQFGGHIRRNTAIQIYNSVFVGSYLEGVHFDKTNAAAVFKGNYFGRIGVNVSFAVKKTTAGNGYDDANFDADNFNTLGTQSTTDLSATIAGLTATNQNIEAPLSLLAAGSSLLTGAKTVPAGLTQTDYVGAFDATTNWAGASWINYTPNTTDY